MADSDGDSEPTTRLSWRDLQWFLSIVRANNLREAAAECGVSPATLSRCVSALEQALKVELFVRDSRGYTLTEYGEAVHRIVGRMDETAGEIGELSGTGTAVVRISAGSWMSRFLLERIDLVSRAEDNFRIEWTASMQSEDIARRHVHIGIRNRRPEEPRLAGRRLVNVAFATYRRAGSERTAENGWISVQGGRTPSSRWVGEQTGPVISQLSEPTLVLPMLYADRGVAVLPRFVGDLDEGLECVGETIEALTHEQWLVAHHTDRHVGAVRVVLERVATLIRAHESSFVGPGGPDAGDGAVQGADTVSG